MRFLNESEVETSIEIQLVKCGWEIDPHNSNRNVFKRDPKTPEDKRKLGGGRPDYILYAYADSNRATVIIEAKRPNESLVKALEQGKKYAEDLNVQLVIATDGYFFKTWHRKLENPLFLDGREVDELFSPDMARKFEEDNNFSSFSKVIPVDQDELISKFKKANDILKNEGFEAGIERFSEFANLMFLKLQFEKGGGLGI